MKLPWVSATRSDEDWAEADRKVAQVRSHLRVLLNELEQTLARIEDKRRRGLPHDG